MDAPIQKSMSLKYEPSSEPHTCVSLNARLESNEENEEEMDAPHARSGCLRGCTLPRAMRDVPGREFIDYKTSMITD